MAIPWTNNPTNNPKAQITHMLTYTPNKGKCTSIAIIAAVSIVMGIATYLTPWFLDDLNYMWTCGDGKTLITSFDQIIPSQVTHYFTVNGRFCAHVLVQLFNGILGVGIFAIFNGIMYGALAVSLQVIAGVKPFASVRATLTTSLLSLLFFSARLIPSHQIGYIWAAVITLAFVHVFFDKHYRNPAIIALLGLGSIIAGNFQEAYSIGIAGALVIDWCVNVKRYTAKQWVMIIAYGLGTLAICLSPATRNRAETQEIGTALNIFNFLTLAPALYLLICVILWQRLKNKRPLKEMYKNNAFWFNALLVFIIFNLAIGVGSNRQLMGLELCCVVIALRILPKHRFSTIWLAIMALWMLGEAYLIGSSIKQGRQLAQNIESEYVATTDGRVYVDGLTAISPGFLTVAIDPFVDPYRTEHYAAQVNARELQCRHPGIPRAIFTPTFLRGKDDVALSNQIIKVSDGIYLLIRSKKEPTSFVAQRALRFGPFRFPYSSVEVPFDKPEFTSKYWDAKIFSDADMCNMTISSIDIK